VLVEQLEACCQLMEIRAALGLHFVGFNTGRWDYINSVSDAMAWDPAFVNPNIDAITMTIDRYVTAIANTRHEVQQARFELLETTPLRRVVRCRRGIGPRLAGGRGPVGRLRAVLDSVAVVGEWVVALAVILLHATEVHVRGSDEIGPRHALARGDGLRKLRPWTASWLPTVTSTLAA
jgi:hypothetical protein